jgi:hypothetical protein
MPILLISVPIYLIIFFGWLFRKFKIVNDEWIHFLNNFAYYVALPSLIIVSFWEIDFLALQSWRLIFWSLLIVFIFSLLIFILVSLFRVDRSTKLTIFLGSTVGNTVYIGFPMVENTFGNHYLPAATLIATIFLIVPLVITTILIKYWHKREYHLKNEVLSFFKNPLIIAIFIGFLLSFIKGEYLLINKIKESIAMLGNTASPLALFILGIFIHKHFLKESFGKALFISILKMIVIPLIVLVFSIYFLANDDLKIFIFLAAMPVAVSTFVIAEKFSLDKNLIANSIILSTILLFLTAPLFVYLINFLNI